MPEPTDGLDPQRDHQQIEADLKELTRECKCCSAPGILMSSGVIDHAPDDAGVNWGEEYRTWYCEAHIDDYLADGAFSAALFNDLSDDAGPATTHQLTRQYLQRLGFSEERMTAVGFGPEDDA